ncbi:hypothetical protein JCM17961_47450 [Endothiovibrio diazotrophicus]
MAALRATGTRKPVGKYPALQIPPEFALDVGRDAHVLRLIATLGEHGLQVLLQSARMCGTKSRRSVRWSSDLWISKGRQQDYGDDSLASSGGKAYMPPLGANPKPPALRVDFYFSELDPKPMPLPRSLRRHIREVSSWIPDYGKIRENQLLHHE